LSSRIRRPPPYQRLEDAPDAPRPASFRGMSGAQATWGSSAPRRGMALRVLARRTSKRAEALQAPSSQPAQDGLRGQSAARQLNPPGATNLRRTASTACRIVCLPDGVHETDRSATDEGGTWRGPDWPKVAPSQGEGSRNRTCVPSPGRGGLPPTRHKCSLSWESWERRY
jgi:hypothetical protein